MPKKFVKESMEAPDVIEGETCPICSEKKLSLTESEHDIPYFGKVYLFSMTCSACKYHKADLEAQERKEPSKYTFEISSKEDLNVRVVKSSEGCIKIPHMISVESGPSSEGFISNIEGVLLRIKGVIEQVKNDAESPEDEKKAKNMLKKLNRVMWGSEPLKIIIEDPSGNSAIISEKAVKSKIK